MQGPDSLASGGDAEIGQILERARKEKGLTLEEVEHATKIPKRYLAGLEREDYRVLPDAVYARGFLKTYANYLGLDGEELSRRTPGHERLAAPGGDEFGRSLIRAVWIVSLPIIFLEVSETLLQATDTAFLARVGTTEVAALALADTILEFWTVVVVGLVAALLIVISRRLGQGRDRAVGQTFNSVLLLVVLVSVVLAVTLKLGSPLLLRNVVASDDVAGAVDTYLQVAAYGVVFQSISLTYTALYVGLRRTRVLVAAGSVLVLTNLVLSYVLIFGKLGLPPMGMKGAALGEVGAEVATFGFLTIYTLRRLDLHRYRLFRIEPWDPSLAWLVIRTSSPVSLQELLEGLRWFLFFVIVQGISAEALAWSSIVYACYAVLMIPTMAFSETTISMVSNFIGREHRIGRLMRVLSSAAYLVTLPIAVLGLLFPSVILSIFTSDPAAIEGAAGSLRIVLLAMLIAIPAEVWSSAVLGTGDTDAALLIQFLVTAATLAVAYVAAFVISPAPLAYAWISLPASALVGLALSYAWLRSGYWQRRQI